MPHSRAIADKGDMKFSDMLALAEHHENVVLPNARELCNFIRNLGFDSFPVIASFINILGNNPTLFFVQLFYAIRDDSGNLSDEEKIVIDILFEQSRSWLDPVIMDNYRLYISKQEEN